MMLTEQLVLARGKEHHLDGIKRLNVSGCNLTDVSFLQKLDNLEGVALSQNHITSLKYFQRCFRLQELYLRYNDIQDINELIYLRNLPLKRLVLADNPCCKEAGDNYRLYVIKMLPFLEYLDNQTVTRDELELALNLRLIDRNQCERASPIKSRNIQQAAEFIEFDLNNQDRMDNDYLAYGDCQKIDQHLDQRQYSSSAIENTRTQPNFLHSSQQSGLNLNRNFAGENIFLDEPPYQSQKQQHQKQQQQHQKQQQQQERLQLRNQGFDRIYKDNSHHSYMDISEWEKQNQPEKRQRKCQTLPYATRPSFRSERILYRLRDEYTSDYGYGSPRLNPQNFDKPRNMSHGPMDAGALESSRSSSIASSSHGKLTFPRSYQSRPRKFLVQFIGL